MRIWNAGITNLTLNAIRATPYLTETNNCAATLAPGAYCTVQVAWDTTSAYQSDAIGISYDGNAEVDDFLFAPYTISPTALMLSQTNPMPFGNETQGNPSLYRTLTITNVNTTAVSSPNVTVSGDTSFSIVGNTCPASLAPQQSCVVGVAMDSSTLGQHTANVNFGGSLSAAVNVWGIVNSPQSVVASTNQMQWQSAAGTALALPAQGATLATATTSVGSAGATRAPAGHVYEATNASSGNGIQVFDQSAGGGLTAQGVVASGGLGTGASLHSQGGVVREGGLLFAVNGGSDSVSVFTLTPRGPVLRGTVPSGGDLPVSVTVHDGVGYVVNQNSDTVSGFRYSPTGLVGSLRGSTRALTANPAGGITDAAQVSFTPDGSRLLVTEKASNTIDTFVVRDGGFLGAATPTASAGTTPYGFDFDSHGNAIVSEAGSGSVSSYRIGRTPAVLSAAVPDTQAAACWLVVSPSGTTAWAVNAASHTLSSYAIGRTGALTLTAAAAADTGTGGTDTAVSANGRAVHVRLADGVISSWSVGRDGRLAPLGTTSGVTAFGSAGLATD